VAALFLQRQGECTTLFRTNAEISGVATGDREEQLLWAQRATGCKYKLPHQNIL